ncbi:MAG: tetratricopeptide repeat protein [Limisphaerales bacterium]
MIVQTEADNGNPDAQFALALHYTTTDHYQLAAEWYLKAAEQNHAQAQLNLGIMHAQGQGIPRDISKAVAWFRKAADQGEAGAHFHLGTECHRALLDATPESATELKIEAYKWFQLAAAQQYHGSEAASEQIALTMTNEDLVEGKKRATVFLCPVTQTGKSDYPATVEETTNH